MGPHPQFQRYFFNAFTTPLWRGSLSTECFLQYTVYVFGFIQLICELANWCERASCLQQIFDSEATLEYVNDGRNGRPVFPRTHKFGQPLGRFLLLPDSMVAKLVHEMCGQADIAALKLRWIFPGGRSRKEVRTKRLNQYRQICHSADAWRVFQFPWSSHLRGMPIQWQAATCVGCNAAPTVGVRNVPPNLRVHRCPFVSKYSCNAWWAFYLLIESSFPFKPNCPWNVMMLVGIGFGQWLVTPASHTAPSTTSLQLPGLPSSGNPDDKFQTLRYGSTEVSIPGRNAKDA